jgi:hypothetical protein
MTTGKKLDSFTLRDKFNLPQAEIVREARVASERRATIAGWNVSEVLPSTTPPTEEGEYICYEFDIYGFEIEQGHANLGDQLSAGPVAGEKIAAKQPLQD